MASKISRKAIRRAMRNDTTGVSLSYAYAASGPSNSSSSSSRRRRRAEGPACGVDGSGTTAPVLMSRLQKRRSSGARSVSRRSILPRGRDGKHQRHDSTSQL